MVAAHAREFGATVLSVLRATRVIGGGGRERTTLSEHKQSGCTNPIEFAPGYLITKRTTRSPSHW